MADETIGQEKRQVVISAAHTIGSGLVIRWRHSTEGATVVSASRDGVMVHGSVLLDETVEAWITDAKRARDLIRAGRTDEVKAMATHEYDRLFFGDLVPIGKPL